MPRGTRSRVYQYFPAISFIANTAGTGLVGGGAGAPLYDINIGTSIIPALIIAASDDSFGVQMGSSHIDFSYDIYFELVCAYTLAAAATDNADVETAWHSGQLVDQAGQWICDTAVDQEFSRLTVSDGTSLSFTDKMTGSTIAGGNAGWSEGDDFLSLEFAVTLDPASAGGFGANELLIVGLGMWYVEKRYRPTYDPRP